MGKVHVKKGDMVYVLSGKDGGKKEKFSMWITLSAKSLLKA